MKIKKTLTKCFNTRLCFRSVRVGMRRRARTTTTWSAPTPRVQPPVAHVSPGTPVGAGSGQSALQAPTLMELWVGRTLQY